MKSFTAVIFYYVEQTPPDMHWVNREKRNDQEHHEKVSFFIWLSFRFFFFFWENVHFIRCLLYFFINVGKRLKSRSQTFFKTGALKNFAIFTGKHLCWNLFLIKLQDWKYNTVFSYEYCKIFENSFFMDHLLIILFQNFMWW